MEYVELAERNAAKPHLVHRALVFAAPGIGKGKPVERMTERTQESLRLPRNAGTPVDQRAEHVKEQGFGKAIHVG